MTGEHRGAPEGGDALRPFFTEMLAKKGLKLLTINTWPSQQIFSTVPIRTVADWKGKKIRVYGADSANITRAARRVAGQHRLRRGLHGAREEDGGRRHHLRHQRRAHEVLRGREVHQLLVPRGRRAASGSSPTRRRGTGCPRISSRPCWTRSRSPPRGEGVGGRRRPEERARKRAARAGHDRGRAVQGRDREGAQQVAGAAWDTWLPRTGADGKRAWSWR